MKKWIVLIVNVLIPSLIFVLCAESRPSFTTTPPDPFYVLEGDNITFVWHYNLSGTFDRVAFRFISSSPSRTIVIKRDLNLDAVVIESVYQGRIQENINATRAEITIFALQRSESGEYEIDLTNKSFQFTSDNVTVQVQYPSEFNNVSSDVVVVKGDPSITLKCIADGEPTPNITWTKVYANGSDSVVLGTGNQFVLETYKNNSGTYRCTAYNGIGTAPNRTVKVEVNYKPENVKLMMNDSVVCKGDVIRITCSADGKPAVHTCQLFENEIPVNDGNSSAVLWIRKYLKGGNLSYRCVANNTVGTAEKTVNVTVKVPSKVYPLENITVNEGENSTLTCNVSGSPVLTVTWTEVSSRNQSSGIMRYLTNISRNNAGEYKCEATNDCGNSSASTFLTVLYKPENVQLMSSAIDGKACTGEVISFNCSANANPGVASYQLFENETAILNTGASGMWSRKILESEGIFFYKCVANNSLGSEYSMSVTVSVNVPSSIIQITQDQNITEGHNVTLSCYVSGFPAPTVSWIKPGGQRHDGHMLEVTHINRTRDGEYKCEASNECGNATKMATINVQYKPENVHVMSSAMNDKACTGEVIRFNCSANAKPGVTSYQLFENETAILNTSASGMWSKTLDSGGVFVYKCMANNSLGSEYSMSVAVTVNEPSSIIQITEDQSVTEGRNVTLMCKVSGMPPPMVSWMTPDSQPVSGYNLEVTNINRSQVGEYKCEARNECGDATETATIDVQYKPENVQLMSSAVENKACTREVISFNCSANANPGVTLYQLFENETAILNTSASGMWSKTLESEGVFVYKCVANNSLGSEYSMSVTVTVNVPASIQSIQNVTITKGNSITLPCKAAGIPPPMVSWVKVSSGLRVYSNLLAVTNASRNEAGEYRCEVSNKCGNASKTITIDLQYSPVNVHLSASKSVVCENETIIFKCSSHGNPAVDGYALYENDTLVNDVSSSGVWKRKMLRWGRFVYQCVAKNSISTGNSTELVVIVNFHSRILTIQDKTVLEGGNVTLLCQAVAVPPSVVTWIYPGGQRIKTRTLAIRNISRSDIGRYSCESNNVCGNDSLTLTIVVQYGPESVQLEASRVGVCKDDIVQFDCSADSIPAVHSYQLFENGSLVDYVSSSGVWRRRMSSEGVFRYTCAVNNGIRTGLSVSVHVLVYVNSSIEEMQDNTLIEGSSFNLSCQAARVPAPTVVWIKDSSGQKTNGNVLFFSKISIKDAGKYTCEANNPCGNASGKTTINVKVPVPSPVPSEPTKVNKDAIYGSVIGVLALVFGVFIIFKSWRHLKRQKRDRRHAVHREQIRPQINETVEPENSDDNDVLHRDSGPHTPSSEIRSEEREHAEPTQNNLEMNEYAPLNPETRSWEVERENVTIERNIGGSAFGQVAQETATNLLGREGRMNSDDKDVLHRDSRPLIPLSEIRLEEREHAEPTQNNSEMNEYAPLNPATRSWEVERENAIIEKNIGGGAIGQVAQETETNLPGREGRINSNDKDVLHHDSGPLMPLSEIRSEEREHAELTQNNLEMNEYAPLNPATRSWEVERENVIIEKVIGGGAFGQVARGTATNLPGREGRITVAIKMLHGNGTVVEKNDLLSELEVLKKLKPHPHVIKLLGCVTVSDPLLVIIEHIPYGDLLGYLKKSRNIDDDYYSDPDVKPQTSLTSLQLMKFSWQVADGMKYLSSKKIIHRDLAARNVLVGEREKCKVTDFGMARDVGLEGAYQWKTERRVPMKWTAFEALQRGRYTTKSDVWSFGIVLYEIFTIGGSPYPSLNWQEVLQRLRQGYRMPKPRHVDNALYKIMQDCWRENPDDRPTFEKLRKDLKEMENQHQKLINMQHYDNILYVSMD